MPQGWKMELSAIDGAAGEVGQGGRDRRARRGARLRLDLGLRPLPQRAACRRTRRCSSAGRRWPRSASARAASASARWSAARRTATRALLAKITSTIDVITGGRLDWGIGAGWYEHEYKGYGYEFPRAEGPHRHAARDGRDREARCGPSPTTTYEGRYYQLARRAVRPEAAAAAAPADLDRRRRRAAHAAGRRPPRRPLELRRQARRVGAQVRGAARATARTSGATTTRSARRGRREVFIRETEAEVDGGGHRGRSGASRSSRGRAGNLVGTPEQVARRSRPTRPRLLGLRARGAPTTPTPRRSACSPRR